MIYDYVESVLDDMPDDAGPGQRLSATAANPARATTEQSAIVGPTGRGRSRGLRREGSGSRDVRRASLRVASAPTGLAAPPVFMAFALPVLSTFRGSRRSCRPTWRPKPAR